MLMPAHNLSDTAPCDTPQRAVVLRTHGLTKAYGSHVALGNVSLAFQAGEVHVLFGENGAGKSTLISLLAGANQPSAGEIAIGDFAGSFASVAEARRHGVRAVFQEFSLVPQLSVAENIILGEEPLGKLGLLSRGAARREALRLIEALSFELDADARVGALPRGKQQMVEICKALKSPPRVLILDEPTASLSERDARAMFEVLRRLKDQGTAIIYITHRMDEIPALGDRVSVLRDGRLVATVPASTPENGLIELMTGRSLDQLYPSPGEALGATRLALRQVTLVPQIGEVPVADVSLDVRAGEIVGIAGLVGCGKSELAQACFGLRRVDNGSIALDGDPVRIAHPRDAIGRGLWYSPANRKQDGLALGRCAAENIALSGLSFGPIRSAWLSRQRETVVLAGLARRVEFAPDRLNDRVETLSGGNQQKVMLAKGLAQDIGVYVFDEPTVGVDVGACQSIYRCLSELSAAGAAILLVSSNLQELMGLTHRLLVMSGGRVVAEFARGDYDEHGILEHFF